MSAQYVSVNAIYNSQAAPPKCSLDIKWKWKMPQSVVHCTAHCTTTITPSAQQIQKW